MFRKDRLTVKREIYEIKEGEALYKEPEVIIENVKCHLSVNLTNTIKKDGFPYLVSDFTLFLDYDPKISVKENDILLIQTSKGQNYKLYSGEVKIYNRTIQIKCRQEKVIESSK